jgi:hypothetical protein
VDGVVVVIGRAIGATQHRGEVAAPGGVAVDREIQPPRAEGLAQRQDALQGVDGAFLGAADDGHHGNHRRALVQAPLQAAAQRLQVHACVQVHRHADQLARAQADSVAALGHE